MSGRAFTLIEVLVYLALFGLLVSGTLSSLYAMQDTSTRIAASAALTDEAQFVLHTIRWHVDNTSDINTPSPDSTDTSLTLTMPGDDISFRLIDGSLTHSHGGIDQPIVGSSVHVSELLFTRSPVRTDGASSLIVSFEMTYRGSNGQPLNEQFTDILYLPASKL